MNYSTKGYAKKDLISHTSDGWDYKNENEVETIFVIKDEDFFASEEDEDEEMNCIFLIK